MLTQKRKDLQDTFEMMSFHTDAGLKPLSSLINDCMSLTEVWPYNSQALCQLVEVAYALLVNCLEDSLKFCNRQDLGRGCYVARGRLGEMKSGVT